jgi:hypothetical protein
MPRVTVNGTELYHEIRGAGPPVLLTMRATGDGGHFDALADLLAESYGCQLRPARQRAQSRPGRLGHDLAGGAGR